MFSKQAVKKETINILLCIDDYSWNYSRHLAATMISLLETNKKNKIAIFILSSYLPEESKNEIKRIVKLYNQEINFIIEKEIIPINIKINLVWRDDLTMATYYRLFFPKYIRGIDRIIYLDCDVLVLKDIYSFFNMDMKWKAIVWALDCENWRYNLQKIFNTKHYVNAWVLLFDVKKFKEKSITEDVIKNINNKFWSFIQRADQDYLNILYKDDILVADNNINYLLDRWIFNFKIKDALIVHMLKKPYINHSWCPKKFVDLYNGYINKTKRENFVNDSNHNKLSIFENIKNIVYNYLYRYIYMILKLLFGQERAEYWMDNISKFLHKFWI